MELDFILDKVEFLLNYIFISSTGEISLLIHFQRECPIILSYDLCLSAFHHYDKKSKIANL